jgi:DNA-binding IclR family transcriptional regulator
VLGALGSTNGAQRLGELASVTGLTKPTVHRILGVLVADGWATAREGGFYELGPRGRALGAEAHDPVDPVDRMIRELAADINQTVHVGVLANARVLYTHKASAPRSFLMRSRVGAAMSAASTGLGKAMLARLSDREVRQLVSARGIEARTSATVPGVKELLAQLADVRAKGFAIDREENEENVRCVAVAFPLGDRGTGAVSIASITFMTPEPELLGHVPRLRELAQRIHVELT